MKEEEEDDGLVGGVGAAAPWLPEYPEGGWRSREGRRRCRGRCLGKINRREEIRKPRRLPSPSSPLAAASKAADEWTEKEKRGVG